MKVTIELSPEQIDEIAGAVAAKLGRREAPTTLTVAQAAKRLGVTSDTVRRRVKAGIIPRVKCMGVVRIPALAIEEI